ncbi:MAG: SDR family NAD(P)-dependent oxidoreductase [Sneathiella sp.]
MRQQLRGKRAVITGAASGIGRELALALAAHDTNLALSDVNEEGLMETKALILDKYSIDVRTHKVNVADEKAVFTYAETLIDEIGDIDILINNAGFSRVGTFAHIETSSMKDLMDVLFWGTVYMSKAFLPALTRQKGHLINISSLFGYIGFPGQTGYCAAKHAVKGFSDTLSMELKEVGVTVSSVHPGGVKTNIMRNAIIDKMPAGVRSKSSMEKNFEAMAPTTAEKAAQIIVRGIIKKKERIMVGKDAVLLAGLQRLMPVAYKKHVIRLFGGKKTAK